MLNGPFYYQPNIAFNERGERGFFPSFSVYISSLIIAVLATGSLVIFGLSAFDRIKPASNTIVVAPRPNLLPMSNESAKGSRLGGPNATGVFNSIAS